MDFGFSQEQEQLRAAAREYLRTELPASFARAMLEDAAGFTEEAWKGLSELGWLGLTAPERFGGSGLGLLDLVLVLEEAGAVALPGPFVSTVSLSLPAILATADEDQLGALVPEIATGVRRVACAIAERSGLWDAAGIAATARRDEGGYVLDGCKLFVPDAGVADTIVLVARLDDGLGFFALPATLPGLAVRPMQTVDLTRRLGAVTLESVRVESDCLLGRRAHGASVLDRIIDTAKVGLAAEMTGAAERALTMTVEYAAVREQFGRAIATFQAIQHRCADMKVDVENAKSLTYFAAWAIDSGDPGAALAAAMAKAFASDACPRVVADAVQLHGGIGFTWEHDLHIYFKRVKADELTYGDATANREQVARSLELVG
ncbi:MAG TPA: acyl-CoA dehydrogenase [Candidatus Limnocylindrales bacterium]|nr:acyl-CoA dehydrogenase [Candidatus Limnocylindrales bacterium]